jgi:hypothetical protein
MSTGKGCDVGIRQQRGALDSLVKAARNRTTAPLMLDESILVPGAGARLFDGARVALLDVSSHSRAQSVGIGSRNAQNGCCTGKQIELHTASRRGRAPRTMT